MIDSQRHRLSFCIGIVCQPVKRHTDKLRLPWIALWFAALFLTACGLPPRADSSPAAPREVVVFAAASLTDAFTVIGQEFEKEQPNVRIVFNFAGSQQLAQQLGQGAQADLFASANRSQLETAATAGRVRAEEISQFATNSLVIVTPLTGTPRISQLADLGRPGVKLIVAAPEVPAGRYTEQMLAAIEATAPELAPALRANIVSYEQSVRAVLSKVILGEADGGFVYASDLVADRDGQLATIPIPDELNVTSSYWLAPITDGTEPALTQALIGFINSARGQEILAQFGFGPVTAAP